MVPVGYSNLKLEQNVHFSLLILNIKFIEFLTNKENGKNFLNRYTNKVYVKNYRFFQGCICKSMNATKNDCNNALIIQQNELTKLH